MDQGSVAIAVGSTSPIKETEVVGCIHLTLRQMLKDVYISVASLHGVHVRESLSNAKISDPLNQDDKFSSAALPTSTFTSMAGPTLGGELKHC